MAERPFDLVLLDLTLPGRNGMEILSEIRSHDSRLPVIMITAYGTVENAVRAMQSGAANFVQKPWDNEKLARRCSRGSRMAPRRRRKRPAQARSQAALQLRKHRGQERAHAEDFRPGGAGGATAAPPCSCKAKAEPAKKSSPKPIHLNSPRRDKPFVPVNTGSMPTDLLESTLFGHVKGAFTSAIASKKGLFEVADKGTLFLDEIATMGLETQAKILRVLQDRRFMHLGGIQEIQVDVRIIAATNIDLRQMVREGRFREDLFYRLNVITVELPPLRQRKEDIPLLVEFFLRKYAEENGRTVPRVTPEALRPLMTYSWPGNVRELENVIERAVVLSSGPEISVELLPDSLMGRGSSLNLHDTPSDASLFEIVEDVERRVITDMLERCNWNQTEAAERFHVPLSTLNQKIRRLNIEIKKKGRG